MNLIELESSLRQLRLGGMAAVLETRLRQAQVETMPPIDLISVLVSDELTRRGDRLLERRQKQAGFRDAQRTLDNFDFAFNPKMNRSLVFDLATATFIGRREDVLFLGPGGTGKSHLAQAIGWAAIQQGYQVLYRETHVLLDELAEAIVDGTRREYMDRIATVPLLIVDDFGMRKLPHTAAEDLLEIVMRRYERASTVLTSDVQSACGRLGPFAGRCGGGERDAGPIVASRARAEVRAAELADEDCRADGGSQGEGRMRKKAVLNMGTSPQTPGIYRFLVGTLGGAASRPAVPTPGAALGFHSWRALSSVPPRSV